MNPPFRTRSIPDALSDRFRLACAAASEQVLEEHLRSTLELVEHGAGEVPIERLLGVYARLHYLGEQESRKLEERVLAALGRTGAGTGRLIGPRSPLARLARRLRGRSNDELREWVELHTARVELTIVDIHVVNSLDVLRLLEGEVPTVRALALYSERLDLRPTISEIVRLKVLKALHERATRDIEPLHGEGRYPSAGGSTPTRRARMM